MTFVDWIIVVALNGACIVYGILASRETRSTPDWFLARRSLPFWMAGLSLYATAIDSSDLVADAGGIYTLGMSYFVAGWTGTVAGWIVAANWVVLPMYRRGMYTNAEYLEARFGPSARIISALVQVQYRTMVLGIIAYTLFLTLAVVCNWGAEAWYAVVAIAGIAALYTSMGGLKSVAVTDVIQSVIMVAGAMVLFYVVWEKAGGFAGVEATLGETDPKTAHAMLHIGVDRLEAIGEGTATFQQRTPAWLLCLAFAILGFAYPVVNHTQAMRLLGAKSEWDLRMAAVLACAIFIVLMFCNLSMGIFGRALYPDHAAMPIAEPTLRKPDSIYPLLIRELLPPGLLGLTVAAVLAAAFSTFDSIASAISALITRDIYARLVTNSRSDRHYLTLTRWLTPVILFASFAYIPFLKRGMLLFYIDVVAAFVVPLLTLYLMGVFSPVHRRSGVIGLAAGVTYGVIRLLTPPSSDLPAILTNNYLSYPVSMSITAGAMVLASVFLGWQRPGQLALPSHGGWLAQTREAVHGIEGSTADGRSPRLPLALGMLLVAIGFFLSFVVFW